MEFCIARQKTEIHSKRRKSCKLFRLLLLTVGFFSTSASAAFIQKPIPPTAGKNFFADEDGDGKMDFAKIVFLGNLSRDYLDSTIQSFTFYWPTTDGKMQAVSFSGKDLLLDSTQANTIAFDFSKTSNLTLQNTLLSTESKTAEILFRDSSTLKVSMREALPPRISRAFAKHHNSGKDTLTIRFTEPVQEIVAGSIFLEFKQAGIIKPLSASADWAENKSVVSLVWNRDIDGPVPGDSLRIFPGTLTDTAKNQVPEFTAFVKIDGAFPLRIRTNSLAFVLPNDTLERTPIFERIFCDTLSARPQKNELGVALNIGGKAFREFIQDAAKISTDSVTPKDLSVDINMRLYSKQGEYITSVQSKTSCTDKHFENSNCLETPQLLFLRWNFFANNREKVGTGAYLVKFFVTIYYNGRTLWKSDNGNTVQTWGVKR